jgi:hypothetical protein
VKRGAFLPACGVALAALACGAPAGPDPVLERVEAVAADASSARAIAAMLSAYGGFDTWGERRNAEYVYTLSLYGGDPTPHRITRQRHRLALGSALRLDITDLEPSDAHTVRVDGEQVAIEPAGDPSQAEDVEFQRAFARALRWEFRLPWSVMDVGTKVSTRGVRTPAPSGPVPTGPCDVVRLRFEDPSLGSTDDWHDLYISRRSHLLEQVHTYRAAPNDYRLSVWGDHRAFDGIRLATRRATYASDATGAVGRLEAVAEYVDVRFDVDWEGTSREEPSGASEAGAAPPGHAPPGSATPTGGS